MYNITYQLLDIVYERHKFIISKNSAKYTYRHEYRKLSDFIRGGVTMTEWKEANKLLFIYDDNTILFLYLRLRLNEINKAISDEALPIIAYSTEGYLKSEYRNISKIKTPYRFNNKAFQISYHIANLIRANVNIKGLSTIVNSDCHGDAMLFMLPYVLSRAIININISDDYRLTYYTKFSNIIHINNGDYYIDTNHIHDYKKIRDYIYVRCCMTANKVIQTLMLSILSDSIDYRFRAYFIMGNHDKLSILKDSILWISNETKLNNMNSSILMDKYLDALCTARGKPYKPVFSTTDIILSDNNIVNTDSLINNICIYMYLDIKGRLYLFQHGILKPFSKMTDDERLISDPRLISYDPIDMNRDVYCLKMNKEMISYEHIYEKKIEIDTTKNDINLVEAQKCFVNQIIAFKMFYKPDEEIDMPIIIVGHNRNYDFLKLHKYSKLMIDGMFNEKITQNIQSSINDVLLAKIILNDATSNELKTDLMFDELFSIDSYYDSSIVEALKNMSSSWNKALSFEEKKSFVDSSFSYPYYIPISTLKGGTNDRLLIYFIIITFIIITVISIITYNEQTVSVVTSKKR